MVMYINKEKPFKRIGACALCNLHVRSRQICGAAQLLHATWGRSVKSVWKIPGKIIVVFVRNWRNIADITTHFQKRCIFEADV